MLTAMPNRKMPANRYRLGERLSFSTGTDVGRYLRGGWSSQAPTHRWTIGSCATIQLQLDGRVSRDVILRMRCAGLVIPGKVECQRIDVRVNFQKLTTWVVAREGWFEAVVPNARVRDGRMLVSLMVSDPTAPFDHGLSEDRRKLGIRAMEMEVVESRGAPVVDWLGSGTDSVGDVFYKNGNYFRAIRKTALAQVDELVAGGIYRDLAERNLIPLPSFSAMDDDAYGAMAITAGAAWSVYPGNYVFLTLLDAARVWLAINERLLEIAPEKDYGLIDGHYGNFALFGNSRPKWVDVGSIEAHASAGSQRGWFGIDQFVRSFVYPLLIYYHRPERSDDVRRLMREHYLGIPHAVLSEYIGGRFVLDFREGAKDGLTRKQVLASIRAQLDEIGYRPRDTNWSNYRNLNALELALTGRYLQEDQDSRFRAIAGLARRSNAATFLDVGANDGLFSILCAREGRTGIATDVDDRSLNRLYEFLGSHPELQVTVAHGNFTEIAYTADLVLALALTHHLTLGQGFSFAEISDALERMSKKALITEFMPDGLGGVPGHPDPAPNPLPAEYRLETYLASLRDYFAHVEVVDYERVNPASRRILIYCEKAGDAPSAPE